MRKKDPEYTENTDRSVEKDLPQTPADEPSSNENENLDTGKFTKVKNASASGLGTMGRSDEKLSDQSGNNNDTY